MTSKQLNIVLGIVVIALLGVVGYITLRNNPQIENGYQQSITANGDLTEDTDQTTQPLKNTTTVTQSQTIANNSAFSNDKQPSDSKWKIYTNNRVGYQFEYPASGLKKSIDETIKYPDASLSDRKTDLVQFVTANNTYSVTTYVGVKHTTVEDWLQDERNSSSTNHELANYTKRTVAGKTAYTGKSIAVTYVLYKGNVYEITARAGIEPTFDTDSLYVHILSSFKFTK